MDLPSASQMYRLANCNGSRNYIRKLREEDLLREIAGPEAALGTRIHAYLEGLPENLELKAQDIADACDRLATRCFNEFFMIRNQPHAGHYEERLTYHISDTPFFTGKPDRVWTSMTSALDVNFKTGRKASPEPHLNLQLRAEIVLIKHVYKVKEIAGAIIEPLVTQEPEIVVYGPKELKEAETEILEIVDASEWGVARTPGAWCVHCPARAFCPEAKGYALAHPPSVDVATLPLGQEGAERLEKIEIAMGILGAMKDAYAGIVAEKLDVIPGWHISEGKNIRFIKDPGQAYQMSIQHTGDSINVNELINMPIGKLEAKMAEFWKISGKEFTKKFHEVFQSVIGTKRTKGSLERIPKRLLK